MSKVHLPRPVRLLASCLISALLMAAQTPPEPPTAFNNGSLNGWDERKFLGQTQYELIETNGVPVLQGHTQGQASVLYRKQAVNLQTHPLLNWSWKVDRIYSGIDEQSRDGDDFPARLYVVAKTGFLPWETVAINYVWASELAIGESWANPYTDKAQMLVLQSGDEQVGRWVTQQRNVAADFKELFDMDVEKIHGYAVMVDGDNTGSEAMAWFGAIQFNAINQ